MPVRKLAVEKAALDDRYKIGESYCGVANIQWVVTFCGDYLGHADSYHEAVDIAVMHRAKFLQSLEG